jgi:hypothetical protein
VAGLSSGEYGVMDIKCQDGNCASDGQCNSDCLKKGFKKGGVCRIIFPSSNKCCCTIGWFILSFKKTKWIKGIPNVCFDWRFCKNIYWVK